MVCGKCTDSHMGIDVANSTEFPKTCWWENPRRRVEVMDDIKWNYDIYMSEIGLCQGRPWQCWGEESRVVCEKNEGCDSNKIGPYCWQCCSELHWMWANWAHISQSFLTPHRSVTIMSMILSKPERIVNCTMKLSSFVNMKVKKMKGFYQQNCVHKSVIARGDFQIHVKINHFWKADVTFEFHVPYKFNDNISWIPKISEIF